MNTTTAPHAALQAASFVIAFTGEGAACYVVHGGWESMLGRFAQETIGSPVGDLASRTHPNHSEWCMWLESLHDLDEWDTDEGSMPYSFHSEVGEISHVSIYRLSTDGVTDQQVQSSVDEYNVANRLLDMLMREAHGTTKWPENWMAVREQLLLAIRTAGVAATPGPYHGRHCQQGGELCRAGQRDGVVCADDECDIDAGVRPADGVKGGGDGR